MAVVRVGLGVSVSLSTSWGAGGSWSGSAGRGLQSTGAVGPRAPGRRAVYTTHGSSPRATVWSVGVGGETSTE